MAKGKCVGCEKEMTWKPLAKHVAGCKKLAAAADAAP